MTSNHSSFAFQMLTSYKQCAGEKGIRGTTLIRFEKWVREQCPNQLAAAKTKYIKTNPRHTLTTRHSH